MERENRYLVIKRSDLQMAEKILKPEAFSAIESLEKITNQVRQNNGKGPLCCVVVESDWPEYEPTWAAIEERMENKTMTDNTVLTCAYCGHQYPDGTPSAKHGLLTEHITVCNKHPLREAENKIAKLKTALAGLIGAETREELDAMEAVIRSTPAPDSDKAAAINAIDALRLL